MINLAYRSVLGGVLAMLLVLTGGCGAPAGNSASGSGDGSPGTAANGNDNGFGDLSPTPDQAISANNWNSLTINGINSLHRIATVSLDTWAHYSTTQNVCGADASGRLNLADWNRITVDLNAVAAPNALFPKDPNCSFATETQATSLFASVPNTAEIELSTSAGGKKTQIFDSHSGLCTMIKDAVLARQVLDDITLLLTTGEQTDHQRCEGGSGSSTVPAIHPPTSPSPAPAPTPAPTPVSSPTPNNSAEH